MEVKWLSKSTFHVAMINVERPPTCFISLRVRQVDKLRKIFLPVISVQERLPSLEPEHYHAANLIRGSAQRQSRSTSIARIHPCGSD